MAGQGSKPPHPIFQVPLLRPEDLRFQSEALAGVASATEDVTKATKDMTKASAKGVVQLAAVAAIAAKVSGMLNKLVGSMVETGKEMLNLAVDADETANKFDVVFKGVARANANMELLRKEFGLSSETAKRLLADTGDLAAGLELAGGQAFGFALKVAKLGGDLASFQNIEGGVEEATERLAAGLLGNTRNLRSLGIMVKKTDKDYKNLVNTFMTTHKWSKRQAEVLALLQLAYEQSPNAINDFGRTALQAANQMRILDENTKELKTTLGDFAVRFIKLDRILFGINKTIAAITGWWKSLNNETKGWITIGVALVFLLTVLAAIFAALTTAAIALTLVFGALFAIGLPALIAIAAIAGIFLQLVAAVVLATGAISALFFAMGDGEGLFERIGSGIKKVIGFLWNWRQNLLAIADTLFIWADAISTIFGDMLTNVMIILDNLLTTIGNIPKAIKAAFTDGMDAARKELLKGTNSLINVTDNAAKKLEELNRVEFNTDISGLKRRFSDLAKIGAQMLGQGAGTGAPATTFAPTALEGSVEAYKIIFGQTKQTDEDNKTANQKTAENTTKMADAIKQVMNLQPANI